MALAAAITAPDNDQSRSIVLNDTTLRDGEQTPGVAFATPENVSMATRGCRCGDRGRCFGGNPIDSIVGRADCGETRWRRLAVLERVKRVVAHARDKGLGVALGGEDSSRADVNFLIDPPHCDRRAFRACRYHFAVVRLAAFGHRRRNPNHSRARSQACRRAQRPGFRGNGGGDVARHS